jgi:hypothetical protein
MLMKKSAWIFLILTTLIVLLSGCTQRVLGQDNPSLDPPVFSTAMTSKSISPDQKISLTQDGSSVKSPTRSTPQPPESMSTDEKSSEYYFIDKENIDQMGITIRDLSQQEMNSIIKIGINVSPVLEKINEGFSYRSKIVWACYKDSVIGWGYCNYDTKDKLAQHASDFNIFPGVEIDLGTPQQYKAYIAVDLFTEKAIYAAIIPDKHVKAPDNVKPLTEEEKTKLISIASKYNSEKSLISGDFKTDFQWVVFSQNGDIKSGIDYDAVEKGIPYYAYEDYQSMIVYPAVKFESSSWMVSIAIDLKTEKVVDVFAHPLR